jgi:2,4-dienoyl-CoA reductase-like NADH-dependent reductase (Old Yellow Enzyme family)/thioredoxin reductase
MNYLTSLFKPGTIGTMQLRNRIIMAPMATLFANDDGSVSERLCRYYEERAKGGVGLIIVETTAVSREGKGHARMLGVHSDELIPGLRRLVESTHRHGVPIVLQIYHAGRQTTAEAAGGQPVAPSAIACPIMKVIPRELTTEEVERLVDAYAEGARRAKEAGFDAVEIHGAHGYLICQFLSAHSNKRTDKYGGDLEGRMRFALNIVARAKEKVGADFPMLFRVSAQEYVPDGLTLDQTRILAQRLQDAGIHCLDISAGNYEAMRMMIQPGSLPRGCLVPLAEEIKKVVNMPVTVAGRISDPVLANDIIQQGKADFVSLGRPLLADPELPNKAKEGRLEDIRMCTACYHCFDTEVGSAQPLTCAINATVGKEGEAIPLSAPRRKKVVVVGGGPAGMEVARVAALRGHTVILYEQEQALGGQLIMASIPPGKAELATTIRFLSVQLSKLGVEVRLGQKATLESIAQMKPDVVVVATGSSTVLPNIEGAGLPHVAMARDVIIGKTEVGQKVVVAGGGRVGCETALLLASRGKDVTLVRMTGQGRLAGDTGVFSRRLLLTDLRQAPIAVEADSHVERITEEGVIIGKNGQLTQVKADSVVLSPMPSPDRQLAEQLKDAVPELYTIGDAAEPHGIADAIHEGFRVGCKL